MKQSLKDIINLYPNDIDLGSFIRKNNDLFCIEYIINKYSNDQELGNYIRIKYGNN